MRKSALITGASGGIGQEIAKTMAANQYDLHLLCQNNINALRKLSEELMNKYNITCFLYQGDVSDYAFVDSVFAAISHLDVLINNAGISYVGLLSDMTPKEWERVMTVNLGSVFYFSKRAIPFMLQKKDGCIVNISSVWGNCGASMEVAYSASKGGVNAFTKALAKELAPSNIRVNAVACGFIDTPMNAHLSEEEKNVLIEEIPADRIGTPAEVADVVYQLTQSPSYLTGQIITLDGGWT